MIYLDNCATTYPKPESVNEAVIFALENFSSPSRGHYKNSVDCTKMIYNTRESVATFFGIKDALNVSFTSNATESINLVISSLLDENDHVITSIFEHNSVIRPLNTKNISYDEIPLLENFSLDYSVLESLVKENTKAVIITHSSNILGTLIDIKIISDFCKKHDLIFILDTAQSAGIIKIDMLKDNIDIVCFTGHKSLYGISGVGGIVVNDNFNKPFSSTKTGGTGYNSLLKTQSNTMPEVFEAGTPNFIGLNALLSGIDFVNTISIEKIYTHEKELLDYVYNGIKDIDGIKFFGSFSIDRTPILSFTYKDYDTNDIADILAEKYNIATRSGFHCVGKLHYVLNTIKTGLLRISFSFFNTKNDCDAFIKAMHEICEN